MTTIGLFYGSSTGNTEFVADEIKAIIDQIDPDLCQIFNVGSTTLEQFLSFDYLILGIPTWNTGQLQDDWEIFLPQIAGKDMTGKKVAIFGLGDQYGYGFNFLDAVGLLAETILGNNADLYGMWSTEGYEYDESLAEYGDKFLGLGLDEEGQKELTTPRLKQWIAQVLEEFELEKVAV
jgi:flavodoxin I